jgi:hypothetical protein
VAKDVLDQFNEALVIQLRPQAPCFMEPDLALALAAKARYRCGLHRLEYLCFDRAHNGSSLSGIIRRRDSECRSLGMCLLSGRPRDPAPAA